MSARSLALSVYLRIVVFTYKHSAPNEKHN